ncbi:MAG TPA: sigma-70 family RNA polymerase sigma factor [Candidatus Angelobacter sp.]|nr:sigma-70 family RNA polymerase sigma factor [Candidatus Angelobacter sp.]
MNIHLRFKAGKTPEIEREFQHQVEKLQRRLHLFKPDLVSLNALVDDENGQGASASLNLRLPSGQMASQKTAENAVAALKASFTDLMTQLTKHKDMLRKRWSWRSRQRTGAERSPNSRSTNSSGYNKETQVAESVRAEGAPAASPQGDGSGDVGEWIAANLPKLRRFVDRELRYRVLTGLIRDGQVTREEVVDEVIVDALSHEEGKAEQLSFESWFYRLALRAIRHLIRANADTGNVSLDAPAGIPNVTASDENVLQYHQPDDSLPEESVIPDRSVMTPEQIVAGEEMVAQLDYVLHEVSLEDREAFVLYTLEGFTIDEIARITDRSPDRVRRHIRKAREKIQKKLPAQNEFRRSLLQRSHVA